MESTKPMPGTEPFPKRSHSSSWHPVTRLLKLGPRQPTPVLLPGKSHGQRSLVGYSQSVGSQSRHDWATSLHLLLRVVNNVPKSYSWPWTQGCLSSSPPSERLHCVPLWGSVVPDCLSFLEPQGCSLILEALGWWPWARGEERDVSGQRYW